MRDDEDRKCLRARQVIGFVGVCAARMSYAYLRFTEFTLALIPTRPPDLSKPSKPNLKRRKLPIPFFPCLRRSSFTFMMEPLSILFKSGGGPQTKTGR
jgi:hypothetical protein